MSILDALKVQKANQQSVRELASLPQQEIIRMAQMGQIPADVVPVVINEKARMTQQAAQMKAAMQQQQGPQPTVIEQAMQANAQAEMPQARMPAPQGAAPQMPPQAPPQAAPQEAGVAGLPTQGMFQGQNFQHGGIVGLAAGGGDDQWTQTPDGLNVLKSEAAPAPGAVPTTLDEYTQMVRAQTAAARKLTPEEIERDEARKKGMFSQEDKDQQKWMRLMQAGLGIMGGESPYALTNIGKGSQDALKGYGEDLKEQRKQKMDDLNARADAAKAKRLEDLEDVKTGAALYKEWLDNKGRADIARDSQLGMKDAENYLKLRRAAGDKRGDSEIIDEGLRRFYRDYGQAANRITTQAATAAGSQGVQLTGIESTRYNAAVKEVNDAIENQPSSATAARYRELSKQDKANAKAGNPTYLAEDFKRQRINEIYSGGPSGQRPAKPDAAPAAAPAAASTALPASAASQLKKGVVTTFGNGQKWTLDANGQPKQVN